MSVSLLLFGRLEAAILITKGGSGQPTEVVGGSETWDVLYCSHGLSQVYGLRMFSVKIFYTFGLSTTDPKALF